MAEKYVLVRIRAEDYNKIVNKKCGLQKDMEAILGKRITFSNPQFFTAIANGVLEINPDSAIGLFKLKRFKGGLR